MRSSIKRKLLSRRTVLFLMLILLASVVLSYLVPQQISLSKVQLLQWQQAHAKWMPLIEFFGLHHLFTSYWFFSLLVLFLIAMLVAVYDQARSAYRRTFSGLAEQKTFKNEVLGGQFSCTQSEEELSQVMKRNGYLLLAGNDLDINRYVKHPWGEWGVFFLHLGMLIIISAALFVVAKGGRSVGTLVEGDIRLPDASWVFEEKGLFADSLHFPAAMRLNRVTPQFWPQGSLKSLSSGITFVSPQGKTADLSVSLDQVLNYQGMRIYQHSRFGAVFFVVLTDPQGKRGQVDLDLADPFGGGKASYGDFDFIGIPYHIRARYYADAEKKSPVSDNPLLSLRLMDKGKVVGEVSLKKGEKGRLGPYEAHLAGVVRWSDYAFLKTTGMAGVFVGFFVFALGSGLYYFTPPRAIYCRKIGDGFVLSWKGSRFNQHYVNEFQMVRAGLSRGKSDG